MNSKHLNVTLAVLLAIFLYHPLHAQSTLTVKSVKATIQGTSTLHDWESQITQITCLGDFQSENGLLTAIADISVKIPVMAIKSPEGKMMDNKTYEAFQSGEHPYINYTASRAQITTDAARNMTIKVSGSLTMAGTTQTTIGSLRAKAGRQVWVLGVGVTLLHPFYYQRTRTLPVHPCMSEALTIKCR